MQYMSQTISWEDCLVLAIAPLGIVTIIVSAIRVGGPKVMKTVVGRARENMSVVEMELMSSTSREICEMYNGKGIVRCQGSAPVLEFICLWPRNFDPKDHEPSDMFECIKLEEALGENGGRQKLKRSDGKVLPHSNCTWKRERDVDDMDTATSLWKRLWRKVGRLSRRSQKAGM